MVGIGATKAPRGALLGVFGRYVVPGGAGGAVTGVFGGAGGRCGAVRATGGMAGGKLWAKAVNSAAKTPLPSSASLPALVKSEAFIMPGMYATNLLSHRGPHRRMSSVASKSNCTAGVASLA